MNYEVLGNDVSEAVLVNKKFADKYVQDGNAEKIIKFIIKLGAPLGDRHKYKLRQGQLTYDEYNNIVEEIAIFKIWYTALQKLENVSVPESLNKQYEEAIKKYNDFAIWLKSVSPKVIEQQTLTEAKKKVDKGLALTENEKFVFDKFTAPENQEATIDYPSSDSPSVDVPISNNTEVSKEPSKNNLMKYAPVALVIGAIALLV